MYRLKQQEASAALLRTQDVAVCSVVQLLRTIAVDGFALTSPGSRDQKPVCPVLELVLSASPSVASPDLQNKYQTLILNSILDHLQVKHTVLPTLGTLYVMFAHAKLPMENSVIQTSLCRLLIICLK